VKNYFGRFGLIGLVLLFSNPSMGQFPALSPYLQFVHFNFERVIEANGTVPVYGPQYKTFIKLDAGHVHSGDSSFFAQITGRHGSTNCNAAVDSCQRHRGYLIQYLRGHKLEAIPDTSRYVGVLMKSPIWTSFWYRYQGLVLRTRPGGNDWESPGTWATDTADLNLDPVTIVRDSAGYIHWEHVPTVDSSSTLYQLKLANDPTGAGQIRPGEWAHIQCYLDNDSANGFAMVWVTNPRGTFLHSTAYVHGRNGTLAKFHGGLYASPAVDSGRVWNDALQIEHVPDTSYAIHYLLDRVYR
jgi:hypothetical protein